MPLTDYQGHQRQPLAIQSKTLNRILKAVSFWADLYTSMVQRVLAPSQ